MAVGFGPAESDGPPGFPGLSLLAPFPLAAPAPAGVARAGESGHVNAAGRGSAFAGGLTPVWRHAEPPPVPSPA